MPEKTFKNTLYERFPDVKKRLDVSKSYLIFENDIKQSGESILDDTLEINRYLADRHPDWQKVYDKQMNREYLIIQIEPGNEDDILGRLMTYQLPKKMVYYVYKATP